MAGASDDIEDLVAGSLDAGALAGSSARLAVALQPARRSMPADAEARAHDADGERQPAQLLPGRARIWVRTFGCSHNTSDAEYMAGQLQAQGYQLLPDAALGEADLWLLNTCTVKSPSQGAAATLIAAGKAAGKALLVTGCVPAGDKKAPELAGLSLLGPAHIDRVVEAVEAALAGQSLVLLGRKRLPRLDLPKVRRNACIEIVPLSTGDLGTNIAELLRACVAVLPPDGRTMLRLGMTNQAYMLDHLGAMAEALRHPCVYACLHLPVQSGSDAVLGAMRRAYSVTQFRHAADSLLAAVPGLQLATDIIAGFPGESDADWAQTMALVAAYRFPATHISQSYPRPGTPAARMKRVPTQVAKARSRQLTQLVASFTGACEELVGSTQRVAVVDTAADGRHLVAHTANYTQVLLEPLPGLMGCVAEVAVESASRWSVKARLLRVLFSPDVGRPTQLPAGLEQQGAQLAPAAVQAASAGQAACSSISSSDSSSNTAADDGCGEGSACGGHGGPREAAAAARSLGNGQQQRAGSAALSACGTGAGSGACCEDSEQPPAASSSSTSSACGVGLQQPALPAATPAADADEHASSSSSKGRKEQASREQQAPPTAPLQRQQQPQQQPQQPPQPPQQQLAARGPQPAAAGGPSSKARTPRGLALLLAVLLLLMAAASVAGLWTVLLLALHVTKTWQQQAAAAAASECRLQW